MKLEIGVPTVKVPKLVNTLFAVLEIIGLLAAVPPPPVTMGKSSVLETVLLSPSVAVITTLVVVALISVGVPVICAPAIDNPLGKPDAVYVTVPTAPVTYRYIDDIWVSWINA